MLLFYIAVLVFDNIFCEHYNYLRTYFVKCYVAVLSTNMYFIAVNYEIYFGQKS